MQLQSAQCFFQLRQLRRVRRSLDSESAATLVHAFVTSRIDYGNALFANATKSTTDKLQRVLNAAARVISGTLKFDRGLSRIIRDDLHCLNVPQRVTFKVCMTVYKCLHGLAPPYLAELCAGCRRRGAPSAPFCEPGSPRLPSVQHVKLWPTCVLVRRHSCLELAAGILAPSFIPFRVQTLSEDILVQVAKRS